MIWFGAVCFGLAIGQGAILFRTSHIATGLVSLLSCSVFLCLSITAVRIVVGAA